MALEGTEVSPGPWRLCFSLSTGRPRPEGGRRPRSQRGALGAWDTLSCPARGGQPIGRSTGQLTCPSLSSVSSYSKCRGVGEVEDGDTHIHLPSRAPPVETRTLAPHLWLGSRCSSVLATLTLEAVGPCCVLVLLGTAVPPTGPWSLEVRPVHTPRPGSRVQNIKEAHRLTHSFSLPCILHADFTLSLVGRRLRLLQSSPQHPEIQEGCHPPELHPRKWERPRIPSYHTYPPPTPWRDLGNTVLMNETSRRKARRCVTRNRKRPEQGHLQRQNMGDTQAAPGHDSGRAALSRGCPRLC